MKNLLVAVSPDSTVETYSLLSLGFIKDYATRQVRYIQSQRHLDEDGWGVANVFVMFRRIAVIGLWEGRGEETRSCFRRAKVVVAANDQNKFQLIVYYYFKACAIRKMVSNEDVSTTE